MIVYPTTNYNSWISEDDVENYFENHLSATSWDALSEYEPVMITAFRALKELSLNIAFADDKTISSAIYSASEIAEILQDLKYSHAMLYNPIAHTVTLGISEKTGASGKERPKNDGRAVLNGLREMETASTGIRKILTHRSRQ